MSKADQITEEQMTQGLKKIGGFGSFKQDSTSKKDSPFSFTDKAKTTKVEETPPGTSSSEEVPPSEKIIELRNSTVSVKPVEASETLAVTPSEEVTQKELTNSSNQISTAPIIHQRIKTEETSIPAKKAKNKIIQTESSAASNSDYDKVSVFMSPAIRDRANQLASELQRKRTIKTERITANTVFRVAIRVILEELSIDDLSTINSEDDLYRAAKGRIRK